MKGECGECHKETEWIVGDGIWECEECGYGNALIGDEVK